jgi:hypothetical protein
MSTLVTNNIQNLAGTASTSADNVINGSAKAWVRFSAPSGTATINASYNVSSVTYLGTAGQWQVNFTNAFADSNYSVSGSIGGSGAGDSGLFGLGGTTAISTTSCKIVSIYPGVNTFNASTVSAQFFR